MIKLKKGNRTMEVRTELQASAFVNSGWERVGTLKIPETATEPEKRQSDGEKKYTKTEIARMKADDLRALAAEAGLPVTEESIGTELKDALIEHYGL